MGSLFKLSGAWDAMGALARLNILGDLSTQNFLSFTIAAAAPYKLSFRLPCQKEDLFVNICLIL